MEEITPVPLNEVEVEKKEENKEGKAAKKWSIVFFIFSCLSLIAVLGTFVLPILIILFGLLSVIAWCCFILAGSVFTIGLMWTIDGVKEFNHSWMAFNNMLFEAGNVIAEKALQAVPYIIVVGAILFAATWPFMIVGRIKDKNRKKYYTGMIIALSVLTVFFVAASILTMVAHNGVNA